MANWYYVQNGQRLGPVEEAEFQNLMRTGTIEPQTLVWCSGMENWLPLSQAQAAGQAPAGPGAAIPGTVALGGAPSASATPGAATPQAAAAGGPVAFCAECGRSFSQSEMVSYNQAWVCAACKPLFFQKVQEGVSLLGAYRYGGFWIRFVAKFLDGIITNVIALVVILPMVGLAGLTGSEQAEPAVMLVANLVSIAIPVVYVTFFLGRFGATPGKMALGLRVIRSDGSRITYLRALGRHFSEILSGLILMIGYIMAAFDDEKRALHDHICDTRVVYK